MLGSQYNYLILENMSDNKPRGEAIHVVSLNAEDHTFNLNEDALRSILMRKDVKDKHLVIVSIAGAFRKGKSFMLSFFIRFLQAKVSR